MALAVSCGVLLLLNGCTTRTTVAENADGDAITMLMNAEYAPHVGQRQPPTEGWQALSMHEPLFSQQPEHATSAWVQFTVPADQLQADSMGLIGVYFWRFNSNIAVWFNGAYLGDGGAMGEKPSRNWNRPLYFAVPEASVKAGDNIVQVELAAWPGEAWIGPPLVGPHDELQSRYKRRMWLQIRTAELAFAFSLIVGLMAFAFWLRQRSERQYFWFAIGSLAITVWSAYYFVQQVPFDGLWFRKLAHWGMDAWSVCMVLFFYASLNRAKLLRNRFLLAILAVLALAYGTAASAETRTVSLLCHGVTLVMSTVVTAHMAVIFIREKISDALVFAIAMMPVLAFAVHDLVQLSSSTLDLWTRGVFMTQYAGVISTFWLTWHLTRRYALALSASQQQQSHLAERVAEARLEQAAAFEKAQRLETVAAVSSERERIFRDLHDDVGAKLLSLVYSAKDERSSDLARTALEDLRDTVSRVAEGSLPLLAAVDDWKDECDKRLSLSGTALNWQERAIPADVEISQAYRTAMGRVLREAISNALRHAAPAGITVLLRYECATGSKPAAIHVSVKNDGAIGDVSHWQAGRGLANIQLRCRQLGGSARWYADGREAVLEYFAPLQIEVKNNLEDSREDSRE